MGWQENAIMQWRDAGGIWRKVTDHNRSPLDISIERIENKQRMVDGTLRRHVIAKKRTFSASWDMLPSTNSKSPGTGTVDGGWAGEDIQAFHNETDGEFQMQLRGGDGQVETVTVMISDFSKEVVKRGIVDFWSLSITLEEV